MQKIKQATRIIQMANFFKKQHIDTEDLLEKTKAALKKPLDIRDNLDQHTIEKMMSRLEYFQNVKKCYGYKIFKEVCHHLDYKSFPANSEVIQIYKPGTTFYVILKGSVSVRVYLPKLKDENQEQMEDLGLRLKTITTPTSDTPNYLNMNEELFETQEVNILYIGQSFGELALLESTSKTTAQIVTIDDCEFACLDRKQFQAVLGNIKRKEMKEKLDFLKSIPFLQGWYENDIKTLSYHFHISTLKRHSFVYKENQKSDKIYLIKSGEIELIKRYHKEFHKKIKGRDFTDLKTIFKGGKEIRYITVCKMNPGEIFGEEALLEYVEKLKYQTQQESRQYSAFVILNDTEIYAISKNDLNRRIWQKESRNVLNNLIQQKWNWRFQRAQLQLKIEGQDQNQLNQMMVNEHLQKVQEFLVPDQIFEPPQPENEPIINKIQQKQNFYRENKGKQISAPSVLLLNVLEVQQTYKQYQSAKFKQNQSNNENQSNTMIQSNSINLKNTKHLNCNQESNRFKFKTLHDNQWTKLKKSTISSSSQVFQRPQINKQLYLTSKIPSIEQYQSVDEKNFMSIEQKMENFFSQLNIDKDIQDDEVNFEQNLESFGQIYKNLNKNNLEEISKKAKILEEEFQVMRKNQELLGKNLEIPHQSENKIKMEHFIRNLKKFQKKLKVLKQVRQGLIECNSNQFVNDDGEIQQIKEEDNFQYNFITQRDFKKQVKNENQYLMKRTSHIDNMINDLVNKIQIIKKQKSDLEERNISENPLGNRVRRKSSVFLNKVTESLNETKRIDSNNSNNLEDFRLKKFVRKNSKFSSEILQDNKAVVQQKFSQMKKNLIMSQYKTSFQTQNTAQTSTDRNTKQNSNYELTQWHDTIKFKRVYNYS